MHLHEEVHRLIELLDGSAAKQQLHAMIDDLGDEQAHQALRRLQAMASHSAVSRHRLLERQGFLVS